MTYAVVVSARMSSTRLPGKALVSYCPDNTPNLAQIVARWQSSRRSPTVIVATSDQAEDAPIAELCARVGVPCYRGPRDDVVARMDGALRAHAPHASHVARALADNPMVDIPLSDWRYDVLCETGADGLWYNGNESRITYAGTTDIWSRAAWDRIAEYSTGDEREHAGAYYWNNLHKFSAYGLPLPAREYLAPIRTELDTPEDLALFRAVWKAWDTRDGSIPGAQLNTLWALQWLSKHPEVTALNAGVELKTQSKAVVSARGSAWLCPDCRKRNGTIDAGNLVVRCNHCGKPSKFYAHKPAR